MNKNNSFFKSFNYAATGLIYAVKRERNLRFHIVVGNLIMLFAYFFGLTNVEWAILFITILMVVCMEVVNTAIEKAVDVATKEYNSYAKAAKDTAAGAVLLSAILALIVGLFLFLDVQKIIYALHTMFTNLIPLIFTIVIVSLDVFFLLFGGKRNR